MRFGVLTGGGDCPGLNAVIRAIVRKGVAEYGHEFVGFRDGWRGPLEGDWRAARRSPEVRGILPRGGTILGSSRTNPFKERARRRADRAQHLERERARRADRDRRRGHARRRERLHAEHGINVVGVPKTIDNDLGATDYTFGFDTAVNIAMEAIDRLHTTAESHHRMLIVEVMGRHAGWIALHSGLAGGAERDPDPRAARSTSSASASYIERRFESQYAPIVVVAEGAMPRGRRCRSPTDAPTDEFGHVRLGGIGHWLEGEIEAPNRARGARDRARPRPARRARRPPSTACSRPASASHAIDAAHEGRVGEDDRRCAATDIVLVDLAEAIAELQARPRGALPRRPRSSSGERPLAVARLVAAALCRLRRAAADEADGEATLRGLRQPAAARARAAADGRDAADGARWRSPTPAARRAGSRSRRCCLDDTEGPGGEAGWTPPRPRANARAATQDSTAIAYLGDFESGATRASLPITNEARMLQVSPASGAVDLVAPFPGSDEVPEVQPSGERTFGRVIPSDDAQAAAGADWVDRMGVRRVATALRRLPVREADGLGVRGRAPTGSGHEQGRPHAVLRRRA